jgi:hypothetical protein
VLARRLHGLRGPKRSAANMSEVQPDTSEES